MSSVEVPPLERKLVAILAADVEGYSRLMHENEEQALATLTGHRAVIDSLIASCRGEISGTSGDSVLAEFASVVDALHCAVAIQQQLEKANGQLTPGRRMALRIGINVGDVMIKDGGIFGDGVNVAARLEAIAEPGGICVTRGVRDHLRDRMEYEFDDLGEHRVKNISRPVRVFRVKFDPSGSTNLTGSSPESASSPIRFQEAQGSLESEVVELAFWESVRESDDPVEYQAYLDRFPAGSFVMLAVARLASPKPIEPVDQSVELEFWNSIKDSGLSEMFGAYLEKYPEGEFRNIAEIRLATLRDGLRPRGL